MKHEAAELNMYFENSVSLLSLGCEWTDFSILKIKQPNTVVAMIDVTTLISTFYTATPPKVQGVK